jgi:hypothetical protein
MVKESEEKEVYTIEEVPTQTMKLAVNLKENKVMTDEVFKIEVLNKLDKILKSVG